MVKICNTPYDNNTYNSYFEWYPYSLSDFQKYAIESILEGQHVLVTAHTGSGKTLPAEFAIRYFVEKGKRVIYTSPIKALSNQKYYEFSRKYPDITFGLFTGDIKTNPEADVLIMTTEILMNALFNQINKKAGPMQFNMNIETELAAVVFDEIHYINDPERGQTWEKTLLMLPGHIQRIMLSATIDSPERFAAWCEKVGNEQLLVSSSELVECPLNKQVYWTGTNHRVVPLTHYGFVAVSENIFKTIKNKTEQQEMRKVANQFIMIQSDKGKFQEIGYKTIADLNKKLETHPFLKRKYVLNQLLTELKEKEMLPAIGFLFSRKQVELCAQEITTNLLEDDSKTPYTISRECEQIVRKLSNYEEYLQLPEYVSLVKLLEKGIGIHHSGMIPILREIVELFISKNHIKLLFATESFAIGLDCPIKTAFFVGLNKFDGTNERLLHSHEYTQMAGRAGRRGIDTIGNVIHCNNLFSLPTQTEYRDMLGGGPPSLISKFRISYSLLLNLLKSNSITASAPLKIKQMVEFMNKSMMFDEIRRAQLEQERVTNAAKELMDKKQKALELNRTPESVCLKYIELEMNLEKAVNKKRKEIQREMERIQDEHRTYKDDAQKWKEYNRLKNEWEKETSRLEFTNDYIYSQVRRTCDVLIEKGFVERILVPGEDKDQGKDEGQGVVLTLNGEIASYIAETHPLIWTDCMITQWNYFADFSTKQLVGLFSCLTDIKVTQEYKTSLPKSNDVFLQEKIKELSTKYLEYDIIETQHDIRSGIRYLDALNYDIIDESMEWCDCKTEEECKWFIQTKLAEKAIQIGDFAKAMMKIVTIANEFMAIGECHFQTFAEESTPSMQTEWLHKLSEIEGMALKYIATSQSLYV
jgi:superfamily II RNA helicase